MTDLVRLANAAHYVIARTDPSKLGRVKLHKTLWYADLEHYRRHAASLTGLDYYTRMPQGPMSKDITRAVRLLKSEGKIAERPVKVIDYTRHELIWLTAPDISRFNAEQIDILNRMMEMVVPLTADEVSQLTHRDSLWKGLPDDTPMPIGAASVVAGTLTQKHLQWAMTATHH